LRLEITLVVGAYLVEFPRGVFPGPRGLCACVLGPRVGGRGALIGLRGLREGLVASVIGAADEGLGFRPGLLDRLLRLRDRAARALLGRGDALGLVRFRPRDRAVAGHGWLHGEPLDRDASFPARSAQCGVPCESCSLGLAHRWSAQGIANTTCDAWAFLRSTASRLRSARDSPSTVAWSARTRICFCVDLLLLGELQELDLEHRGLVADFLGLLAERSRAADLGLIPALGISAHRAPPKRGNPASAAVRTPADSLALERTGRHPVRDLQEKTC
jgi:hypothetical protein